MTYFSGRVTIMPRFSNIVKEHFHNPRNVGRIRNPDATGRSGKPGRSAFMVMDFTLEDGVVKEVRYQSNS